MEDASVKIVTQRDAPSLVTLRRVIIFIVCAYTAIFGVPLWFGTTAIYRASLPVDEINSLVNDLTNDILVKIPVTVIGSASYDSVGIERAANRKVVEKYPLLADIWQIQLKEVADSELDYVVKLLETKETPGTTTSLVDREITIGYSPEIAKNPAVIQDLVASSLVEDVFVEELQLFNNFVVQQSAETGVSEVFPYSRRYNIVFSLFTEGGHPISWDITKVTDSLELLLHELNDVANFSITSQVQYYSKLAIHPEYNEETKKFEIAEKDLSTFINFGDWNLFSHELTPTINFVVYFADSNYESKPLTIKGSSSQSFLVPQWGGVYLFNKDKPILKGSTVSITESEISEIADVFVSQLFRLLGLPSRPKSFSIKKDILSRTSTIQNLKKSLENLVSLVKLTESLDQISIPELTKESVENALTSAKNGINSLNVQRYGEAATEAAVSLESSNKAFFEKEMVQQAYFPQEHMLAVYLPLLGPLVSIIAIGTIRTIKDIKRQRAEIA